LHEILVNKIYTSEKSFVKIYLKVTKLCRFNEDTHQFFSLLSVMHAQLAASVLSQFMETLYLYPLDYYIWSAMLEE